MPIRSLLLWCWGICVFPLVAVICANGETPSTRLTGPIRTAYVQHSALAAQSDLLSRLALHGFTHALVSVPKQPMNDAEWKNWENQARNAEILIIPTFNFAVPRELRERPGSYRPYVNRQGRIYAKTPCPTDEVYWQQVIGDRFVRLTEIAQKHIIGVVFDAEMYGSDISWYADLCYCDVCWQRFYESGLSAFPAGMSEIPAESRFAFLMQHGLLQAYTTFQWNQVRSILAGIEERVHHIRPQFRLGFLCYRHNWFFTALVQGLGTPENPALVFSESSYVRGYTPYVDRERDHVRGNQSMSPVAEYVPGIWLERFSPEALPAQIVDLALNTDGYWLYTSGRFWRDDPETETWHLNGPKDAYWSAIQYANSEQRRLCRLSVGAHRKIGPVKQSSFYDTSHQRLFTTPELHDSFISALEMSVSPDNSTPHAEPDSPAIYRGQTLFHCLPQTSSATFTITHIPVGKDTDPELFRTLQDKSFPISYMTFDSNGNLVQEGTIEPSDSPKTLSVPTENKSMVSLLVDAEINGAQVIFSDAACVVEASSTFPLETFQVPRYYMLFVPPGTHRLNFRAHTPRQEAARIVVTSLPSEERREFSIKSFTEFQIGSTSAELLGKLMIQTVPEPSEPFGDVRVYLYDAAFPYLKVPEP